MTNILEEFNDDDLTEYEFSLSNQYADIPCDLNFDFVKVIAETKSIDEFQSFCNEHIGNYSKDLQIPNWIMRIFLIIFKWNFDEIRMLFKSNPWKLFSEAGLIPKVPSCLYDSDSPDMCMIVEFLRSNTIMKYPMIALNSEETNCSICCGSDCEIVSIDIEERNIIFEISSTDENKLINPEPPKLSLYGMSCGHKCCADCWKSYITLHIQENSHKFIKCINYMCDILVAEDFIAEILKDSNLMTYYETAVNKSIISYNPNVYYCANDTCQTIICVPEGQSGDYFQCSACKVDICLSCGHEFHWPIDCKLFYKWTMEGSEDYMNANTKRCPKCFVKISKDAGCLHMSCSRCTYEFCWICLKEYKEINHESCNKFNDYDPSIEIERKFAIENYNKYILFYDKWESNIDSPLKQSMFINEIVDKINLKLKMKEGTWIEWQYILDAAEIYSKCRRSIKYIYLYMFYSKDEINQDLMDYHYNLLQEYLDKLLGIINNPDLIDTCLAYSIAYACKKYVGHLTKSILGKNTYN